MEAIAIPLTSLDVRDYISAELDQVYLGLGTAFKSKFESGRSFVIAPPNTSETTLRKFSAGGVTPPGKEFHQNGNRIVEVISLADTFARLMAEHIREKTDAALVLYDPLCEPEIYESAKARFDLSSKPFLISRSNNFSQAHHSVGA